MRCISGTCPADSPQAVLCEPVGDGHGEAEETKADAVHLRGDGDVGKEGVVPAHEGIAALKVFDDVEDLLALCLPHHPPYVQQGGDVLLPVGRKDTGRKGGRRVLMEFGSVWCRQGSVMILSNSHISLSHTICFWEGQKFGTFFYKGTFIRV